MILWSGTLGVCCAWQNGSEHGVSGDINAFVDSALGNMIVVQSRMGNLSTGVGIHIEL